MECDLDSSSHSVYSLKYHLVMVVKYRRKVFEGEEIVDELKSRTKNISENYDVEITDREVDEDHIRILFSSKPTTDLIKFINALKTGTSKAIRHRFDISDKLWEDVFWSDSYCLTPGEVTLEKLKEYVEDQGKEDE